MLAIYNTACSFDWTVCVPGQGYRGLSVCGCACPLPPRPLQSPLNDGCRHQQNNPFIYSTGRMMEMEYVLGIFPRIDKSVIPWTAEFQHGDLSSFIVLLLFPTHVQRQTIHRQSVMGGGHPRGGGGRIVLDRK